MYLQALAKIAANTESNKQSPYVSYLLVNGGYNAIWYKSIIWS